MLMSEFIKSDTAVPTTGIGLVVRAGAARPRTASFFTPTDALVQNRGRPCLD